MRPYLRQPGYGALTRCPTGCHRLRPSRHDENPSNRAAAPMPAVPDHAVASFCVGSRLGRVPGGDVVELLLHIRRGKVEHPPKVLEHGLDGIICIMPRGELAAPSAQRASASGRAPSGGARLLPPVVRRSWCRGARHQLTPLGPPTNETGGRRARRNRPPTGRLKGTGGPNDLSSPTPGASHQRSR